MKRSHVERSCALDGETNMGNNDVIINARHSALFVTCTSCVIHENSAPDMSHNVIVALLVESADLLKC